MFSRCNKMCCLNFPQCILSLWDKYCQTYKCEALPVYASVYRPDLSASLPVYLSLAERRSVVIGSCWMVWCSIRANKPARFVMAILRFLSCSNNSSSLYHWQRDRQAETHGGGQGYLLDSCHHCIANKVFFLQLLTTLTRSRSTSARRSFSQQ